MTDHLLFETDDHGIAWITFNRPEVRNATSIEMIEALHQRLLEIESSADVRCVVLRGAGEHFMAGGDIGAFASMTTLAPGGRRAAMRARLAKSAPLFSLLERLPQPVLASVRGAVAGGGVGFVVACDLAIAASDAKFVLSHVNLGLTPDGSSSWHLPRTIGVKKAKQLAFLGDAIDAATALEWGMLNWLAAPDEIEARTLEIARRLAAAPQRAVAGGKRLLNASLGNTLAEQVMLEGESIGACAETDDFVQRVRAFTQRKS